MLLRRGVEHELRRGPDVDAGAVARREAVFGEVFTHNAVDLDRPASSLRFRWVVEGDWKLIVPDPHNEPRAAVELFDLAGDPSESTNLAGREPVRRRFRLDDDDLSRIQQWVAQSGIRWGLDAAHRAPFKLSELEAGTWRFGLDRVLVGVTMSEDEPRLFGDVLPLDDVASNAVDVAGRFAELVESLGAAVTVLIIEHDLDVVFRLATRVTVLHLGRVLADGTPDEVRADETVQRAYLGDAALDDLFFEGTR